jgi:predicted HNH restriction endonuclease
MATWKKDIIKALTNLGGTAQYEGLYDEVKRIRTTPLPDSWKKIIQRTVQDHAGESDGFKNEKLFYSVSGIGSGVWGLLPESNVPDSADASHSANDGETTSHRNLTWSRDELILALELYLRYRTSPPGKDSQVVGELSAFLNRIGTTLGRSTTDTFRNAKGVYMKLMNFRRFDQDYTSDGKVGLTRGNKDEALVWAEFSGDSTRLQDVVNAIRLAVQNSQSGELISMDEPEIVEAEEGRVLTRMHRIRERSRSLVEQCKKAALKAHGKLACQACGFDFSIKYGDLGIGIIEVHHIKPVHTLTEGNKTKLEDLALLCANCHRVVHSSRRWLTVEQVKAAIRK